MTEENEIIEEEGEDVVADLQVVYVGENPDPDNSGNVQIVAKKDGKSASVFYNYGNDLTDMVTLFGEDVVFSNARSKMKINLQAAMRAYLKAGRDIGQLMEVYKPGVALEKIPTDMNKATEDYFTGLSDEEQTAMIERLMAKKA